MGRPFLLNNKKIKALYSAMLHGGIQIKYISYNLGVKEKTIRSWIAGGDTLCDNFEEELAPLEDIFPYMYMDLWENKKEEYECEFRRINDIEDKIPDRLYNSYMNFMDKERKKFIESNIARRENEILKDIKLVDDKTVDEQYKMMIRFARIYHRGVCTVEMSYLNNIERHCGTSKNVGLSLKMLEKLNKEDFGETSTVKHTGEVAVNNKSILSLAIDYEKQQKLQQQSVEKIDVNNMKRIEQKD